MTNCKKMYASRKVQNEQNKLWKDSKNKNKSRKQFNKEFRKVFLLRCVINNFVKKKTLKYNRK
jgi:hypothetical protein